MILVYTWMLSAWSWLGAVARRIVPPRVQLMFVDANGDVSSTLGWLVGIAVIAGVAGYVILNIITPAQGAAVNATNNAISSIP